MNNKTDYGVSKFWNKLNGTQTIELIQILKSNGINSMDQFSDGSSDYRLVGLRSRSHFRVGADSYIFDFKKNDGSYLIGNGRKNFATYQQLIDYLKTQTPQN